MREGLAGARNVGFYRSARLVATSQQKRGIAVPSYGALRTRHIDCVRSCGTINETLSVNGHLKRSFHAAGLRLFPLKRRTMKKLNHVTLLFAAVMSSAAGLAVAQVSAPSKPVAADGGNKIDNVQNGTGELVWKNGTNELCWRDATWTPATAAAGCDGALVPPPPPAPAPAVQAPPPPPPPPAPTPAPQPPAATKVTYA